MKVAKSLSEALAGGEREKGKCSIQISKQSLFLSVFLSLQLSVGLRYLSSKGRVKEETAGLGGGGGGGSGSGSSI